MKAERINQNKNVMYREELIDSIADLSGLSRLQASRALKGVLESIQKGLKEHKRMRITGLELLR